MSDLVIHIGTHKTGSTSIQKNLYSSAELLKSQDVFYPTSKTIWSGHHQLPWALGVNHPSRYKSVTVDDCLSSWLNQDYTKTIISSEDFDFLTRDMIFNLKAKIKDRNVRIVVYLRDQVSYLISDYKQHVQMGSVRFSSHLNDFYFKYNFEKRFNYHALLMPWVRVFGLGSMDVRSFNRDNLISGDVVQDFFSKEGLDRIEVESENVSITDLQAYACSLMNGKGISLEKQRKIISGEEWKKFEVSLGSYSLLTDIQKDFFENRYAASNKKILSIFDLSSEFFCKERETLGVTRESQFAAESRARVFLEDQFNIRLK